MEGSWLDQFNGHHVTILTNVGSDERTDTGTLLRIGDGWLQMVKDNGDMILVPSTAIRLVKLLDMAHTVPSAERDNLPRLDTHIYEPHAQRP